MSLLQRLIEPPEKALQVLEVPRPSPPASAWGAREPKEKHEATFVLGIGKRWLRWNGQPPQTPQTPLQRAKSTLASGDYVGARAIVAEALLATPGDPELRRFAEVIAPPQVLSASMDGPRSAQAANRQWLKEHGDSHAGQWVALHEGRLLAAASSLEEVRQEVGSTSGIFVTRIF